MRTAGQLGRSRRTRNRPAVGNVLTALLPASTGALSRPSPLGLIETVLPGESCDSPPPCTAIRGRSDALVLHRNRVVLPRCGTIQAWVHVDFSPRYATATLTFSKGRTAMM